MIPAHIFNEISAWKPYRVRIDNSSDSLTIYKNPFDSDLYALGPVINGSVENFLENFDVSEEKASASTTLTENWTVGGVNDSSPVGNFSLIDNEDSIQNSSNETAIDEIMAI